MIQVSQLLGIGPQPPVYLIYPPQVPLIFNRGVWESGAKKIEIKYFDGAAPSNGLLGRPVQKQV